MTTAEGGWTLVWSYGFTDYAAFNANANAVTPRPDWGNGDTTVSTTTPTSPSSPGAMPFARWKDIGSEILVTSTINNWIRCTPNPGSLVLLAQGSISCHVVNVVAAASGCTTIAPN